MVATATRPTTSPLDDGTSLLCMCPGCPPGRRQKLGMLYPQEGLRLTDQRHGTRHSLYLDAREVLVRLAGTLDGSAVTEFVRKAMA